MTTPTRFLTRLWIVLLLLVAEPAFSRDAGFDPRVITFGEAREEIKSKPIESRPNRPLHVYGNAVRRRHSRGAARPQPSR